MYSALVAVDYCYDFKFALRVVSFGRVSLLVSGRCCEETG